MSTSSTSGVSSVRPYEAPADDRRGATGVIILHTQQARRAQLSGRRHVVALCAAARPRRARLGPDHHPRGASASATATATQPSIRRVSTPAIATAGRCAALGGLGTSRVGGRARGGASVAASRPRRHMGVRSLRLGAPLAAHEERPLLRDTRARAGLVPFGCLRHPSARRAHDRKRNAPAARGEQPLGAAPALLAPLLH